MLELRGNYVSQIWFCGDGRRDWMAWLHQINAGEWRFEYRFRYYAGPDAWDENDRKNFYAFEDVGTEESMLARVSAGAKMISENMEAELHILPVRTCDAKRIRAALMRERWAHFKEFSADELKGRQV